MTPKPTGWTLDTYAAHNEALRASEEKFQAERDRRYAEVKAAEGQALNVKEKADRDALGLARQIQTYKDEKANELREQINRERGFYASKDDLAALADKFTAMHEPVVAFMARGAGSSAGASDTWKMISLGLSILLSLIALGTFVFVTQRARTPDPVTTAILEELKNLRAPAPQIIYTPAPPGTQLPSSPPTSAPPR